MDVDSPPITLRGSPASKGVAVGAIRLVTRRDLELSTDPIGDDETDLHLEKARQVLEAVTDQLTGLQKTQKNREIHEILDAQIQIVHDPELFKRVQQLVLKERRSAGLAFYTAFNEFIQLLQQSGQEWVRDRIVDLQSLRDRIVHQINGTEFLRSGPSGSILFAEELSPAQIIDLSRNRIAAIVMQFGGITSHAVIIAQALDIPCVIGVDWRRTQIEKARIAAVDGSRGEVVINPDAEILADFAERQKSAEIHRQEEIQAGLLPNRLLCGTPFRIRANIEFEEEMERVASYRAEGIGLLRTESLFLRQGYFDIDEHARFYRQVLSRTGDHPVTIRLLDIGGDKLPGQATDELNPFLGWRGTRMLLDESELLSDQLTAILEVACEYPGRIRILLPMVTDIGELRRMREKIDEAIRRCRESAGGDPGPIPVGIMIEVPAIALQANEAAREADFFSIGSNDLIQYVLASDRGNEKVSRYYQPAHPAVWKLIRMSVEAAERCDIPVNICGEMAGNPLLAAALLGLGLRELSMNPASIPTVKQVLCKFELSRLRELQESLMSASGIEEAEQILNVWEEEYL